MRINQYMLKEFKHFNRVPTTWQLSFIIFLRDFIKNSAIDLKEGFENGHLVYKKGKLNIFRIHYNREYIVLYSALPLSSIDPNKELLKNFLVGKRIVYIRKKDLTNKFLIQEFIEEVIYKWRDQEYIKRSSSNKIMN